jgi:hypothetical protein
MSLKEKVVQGATCMCNFGTTPDTLKVLTHSKHYINDHEGNKKLAATHKDIGPTFEKNTFGSCKKMNNNPCSAVVTEWSGYYEKEKYSPPDGYILLEDSKATCPIGGKDCIKIIKTGQIGEPTQKHLQNADEELQSHVSPFINLKGNDIEDPYEYLNAQ